MESSLGLLDANENGLSVFFLTGSFPVGDFMVAEFTLLSAKSQSFCKQENPSEGGQ